MPIRELMTVFLYLAAVFAMPLLGVAASGRPVGPFLEFPPRTRGGAPEPFFWAAFCAVTLLIAIALAPLLRRIAVTPKAVGPSRRTLYPFPAFGWLGLASLGITWIVAWNRFAWAVPIQRFTFTPLWLGYIVLVNALTVTRSGACPLTSETRLMAVLFPLSAVFWWTFEYLNRFVLNWHYAGTETLASREYVVEASLPFSTVLPAVHSTAAWLATYPNLARGLDRFVPPRPAMNTAKVLIILAFATLLLTMTAILPSLLFPLVWVAPVLLMTGLQQILLGRSVLHCALASGDWRRIWIYALAGLVCGGFWELWNFRSLAHWEYRIPYVGRFEVFEMPLLGYAGYLPFGILCASFVDSVRSALDRSSPQQTPALRRTGARKTSGVA